MHKLSIIVLYISLVVAASIDTPPSVLSGKIPSSRSRGFTNAFESIEERIEDTIGHYSAFAGKIFPILSKLYVSPNEAKQIFKEIQTVQEPGDWIFILLLGWATIPMIKYPYEKFVIGMKPKKENQAPPRPFKESGIFHFAEHLQQAGRIGAIIYGLDCLGIALETMGFQQINQYMPSVAKGIYCLWMFSRLNTFKRFIIFKSFGVSTSANRKNLQNRSKHARAKIVNKILDIVCYAACFFVMVDILQVKSGVTLNSLFAVSGAGTVIISLATKDIALDIVSGLALQASDKVYEGESVSFGNGLKGCVDQIGLFETLIRDGSEMVTAVPNHELANQRLANISRNKFSQVKQKIHFCYEDIDRLPSLMQEIKNQIIKSCGFVVTDGSRPFRVYFHHYGESSLEVIVDVRMQITTGTSQYYEGREQVLLAIGRGVKNMNMKFAVMTENLE